MNHDHVINGLENVDSTLLAPRNIAEILFLISLETFDVVARLTLFRTPKVLRV